MQKSVALQYSLSMHLRGLVHTVCLLSYLRLHVHELQVTFKNGLTAVLNCEKFEWNQTKFSSQFKEANTGCEFITKLNEITHHDPDRGCIVPKPESAMVPTFVMMMAMGNWMRIMRTHLHQNAQI